jgi:multicomponent Na+:H+ antiporter subunit C
VTAAIFLFLGLFLAVLGGIAAFVHHDGIHRIIALNIAGSGVFLLLVTIPGRADGVDPVAQALVLTGIVVAVAITGVALVLLARLAELGGRT